MLSVVITNYKTWDLTQRCVMSIDKTDASDAINQIIVVDDGSDEDVPDYIVNHPKVKLVNNQTNLGYVESVNVGFSYADNEVCLLLDSDAYLLQDPSPIFKNFQSDEDLGILGFNLVDQYGASTGKGASEANFWSVLFGQKIEAKINSFVKLRRSPNYTLYSCAIAIRTSMFKALNGFDTRFDFIDGDSDFSMRVNRSNKWKIKIDNSINIYHVGSGSPQLTSKRVIRFYENRIKLLKKHNLFPLSVILKAVIFSRLAFELMYLGCVGRFKYPEKIYKDKFTSRSHVLKNIFFY